MPGVEKKRKGGWEGGTNVQFNERWGKERV